MVCLQEVAGAPLTVPCGPIYNTIGWQQDTAWIALVNFIFQEASRAGVHGECKRAQSHAVELRFRVR